MTRPDWLRAGKRVKHKIQGFYGTIGGETRIGVDDPAADWFWVHWLDRPDRPSTRSNLSNWKRILEPAPQLKIESWSKDDMTTKETNPKDAMGCKKPPLSTIPCPVLFEVGAAMFEGHQKGYRRHNFRDSGVRISIYYDAAMRHLMSFWEGEDIDPDSGVSHVTKAIAGLIVLRDAMMNGMATDDRPPVPKQGWMGNTQKLVDGILQRYPGEVKPFTAKPMEEATPGFIPQEEKDKIVNALSKRTEGPTDKELHDDSM